MTTFSQQTFYTCYVNIVLHCVTIYRSYIVLPYIGITFMLTLCYIVLPYIGVTCTATKPATQGRYGGTRDGIQLCVPPVTER